MSEACRHRERPQTTFTLEIPASAAVPLFAKQQSNRSSAHGETFKLLRNKLFGQPISGVGQSLTNGWRYIAPSSRARFGKIQSAGDPAHHAVCAEVRVLGQAGEGIPQAPSEDFRFDHM